MTACAKCGYDADAVVLERYDFRIDRDPPSLNDRLSNSGMIVGIKYRKERDSWMWEIRAVRLLNNIPTASRAIGLRGRKRRVTLTRYYSGRQKERDQDNLVGGMKVCVDALVLEGLLENDDPGSVELHYQQERTEPTGLRVQIEVLA